MAQQKEKKKETRGEVRVLAEFLGAAITKYHKPGAYNNRNLLSGSSGGQRSETKVHAKPGEEDPSWTPPASGRPIIPWLRAD